MCKQSRTISSHLNPREVLKLVDGQSRTALKDEVMARFGGSRSRAYDWIARLKEGDFVQEDETGSITLTAKAKTVMSGTWRKPILLPKAHARPGKRLH